MPAEPTPETMTAQEAREYLVSRGYETLLREAGELPAETLRCKGAAGYRRNRHITYYETYAAHDIRTRRRSWLRRLVRKGG